MLQEYPTQIQPRSSSTRETQDVIELQDSTNKLDAEASRILIDLANQDTSSLHHFMGSSNNLMMIDTKLNNNHSRRASSSNKGVSLPIKTDANLHLQQERSQPDPIMLLAAAAAVIDDEGKYRKRSYERREIRLHSRHSKRKSFTYGSNNTTVDTDNTTILHRRHSERRHRFQRSSVSMATDTWTTSSIDKEEEEQEEDGGKGSGTHAFSWQYLSMKQNPRIKRNAMHAYITYMIYTDMAHEQQRQKQQRPKVYNNNDWYPKSTTMQSYRLPPSPRQQRHHDPPPTTTTTIPTHTSTSSSANTGVESTIIGRPLTDFLFEGNNRLPSLFE